MPKKSNAAKETKSILIKFGATEHDLALIEQRQREAGYATRAAYILASATRGAEADLTEIARGIGQLGILCNALLDAGSSRDPKLVKTITRLCDQISLSLRRRR